MGDGRCSMNTTLSVLVVSRRPAAGAAGTAGAVVVAGEVVVVVVLVINRRKTRRSWWSSNATSRGKVETVTQSESQSACREGRPFSSRFGSRSLPPEYAKRPPGHFGKFQTQRHEAMGLAMLGWPV